MIKKGKVCFRTDKNYSKKKGTTPKTVTSLSTRNSSSRQKASLRVSV
jgi:hypothetical protein